MVQGSLFIQLVFTSGNSWQDEEQNGDIGWQKVTEMYKISGTPMVLCWAGCSKGWLETFKRPKLVLNVLKNHLFFQQSISLGIKTQKWWHQWVASVKVKNTEHLNGVSCRWEWKHSRNNKERKRCFCPMKCRPSVPQPLPSSWRDYYVQDKYCVLLRIPHTSYIYPLPPSFNFTNDFHKEKQTTGRSPVLNIYTNTSHVNLTCFNSKNPFTAQPFPYFFFFCFRCTVPKW